jgi:N-acetylmuramoyl-L-alanine amidase
MDLLRLKTRILRRLERLVAFIATTVILFSFFPAQLSLAAQRGSTPRSQTIPSTLSAQTDVSPNSVATTIVKLRVGTHPTFTRVVLELTGPQEWSANHLGGVVRIIVPGAVLDPGVQRMDYTHGQVRSVQPESRAGGVEVLVVCDPAQAKVRTVTLSGPDRIVVDVLSPGAEGEARATVRPQSEARPLASHPSGGGTNPGKVPAKPGITTPAQEATHPRGRAASTPVGAEQEPISVPNGHGETRRDVEGKPLTIVLDPGHGGHDTGAIGPSGLMEKDVVLDLAFRLRKLLQDRLAVRVLMTRSEDVFIPVPERSAFANRARADFMISLHVNAANARGVVGFETFYFTREPSDNDARASAQRENLVMENNGSAGKDLESLLKITLADMAVTRDMKESSSLAERILVALDKILKVENRGVKSGPFYVLATAAMPAVLVESAFITNPREERRLQREEYRQRIAEGLYEGIAAYKIRYEQRLGFRTSPVGVGS